MKDLEDLNMVKDIKIDNKTLDKLIFIKTEITPERIIDTDLSNPHRSFSIISVPETYIINELKLLTDIDLRLKSVFISNAWHVNCSNEEKSVPISGKNIKPPETQMYCMPREYSGMKINEDSINDIKTNLTCFYYMRCFWREYNDIKIYDSFTDSQRKELESLGPKYYKYYKFEDWRKQYE